MVLSEDKAAQFRPEMAGDAGWQWRCHNLAARCLPTLTVEIHNVRVDHQVLHHKVRVTFEARALRRSHKRDGALLMNSGATNMRSAPLRITSGSIGRRTVGLKRSRSRRVRRFRL